MRAFLNWKGHSIIAVPARVYLGMVFIMASLYKIAQPGEFALSIATYNILPLELVNIMAICLPYIEIIAGALMVAGVKSRASAWLIVGMMIMFMTALVIALYNGLDMSCGCFASSSIEEGDEISVKTIWRDTGWLLLGVYVLLFDNRPIGLTMVFKKLLARNGES